MTIVDDAWFNQSTYRVPSITDFYIILSLSFLREHLDHVVGRGAREHGRPSDYCVRATAPPVTHIEWLGVGPLCWCGGSRRSAFVSEDRNELGALLFENKFSLKIKKKTSKEELGLPLPGF
ncbi:hypothetical protein EVAR_60809_1 [Eumeta japonica]|uniref:Uncharacterized protein n=1 Tax=Eumeta variegata TaxID=151549 RepID=A0A4C1YMD0_EUMVA|nr:hypothetical protein EVAR_60809_1 [Eumeta japonica]